MRPNIIGTSEYKDTLADTPKDALAKSSYCGTNACVEAGVDMQTGLVVVRGSAELNPPSAERNQPTDGERAIGSVAVPQLIFSKPEWDAFLRGAAAGEMRYDDLPVAEGLVTEPAIIAIAQSEQYS